LSQDPVEARDNAGGSTRSDARQISEYKREKTNIFIPRVAQNLDGNEFSSLGNTIAGTSGSSSAVSSVAVTISCSEVVEGSTPGCTSTEIRLIKSCEYGDTAVMVINERGQCRYQYLQIVKF